MNNVNIKIYPDVTFGYIIEVSKGKKTVPVVVFGSLKQAFYMIESDSFYNFVEVFFND